MSQVLFNELNPNSGFHDLDLLAKSKYNSSTLSYDIATEKLTMLELTNYISSQITITETNDLTSAVTWANVPDANITSSSVSQHQASLSITESQISDLSHFSPSTLLSDYGFTDNSANWNTSFGWGNHASVGYLTSYTETDPIFVASQANNITAQHITDLGNLSGTNSGDNAVNSLYSGLVSNATHTGDVTGDTVLTIAAGAVDIAMLSATGTADATTYLRGDNTWATAGGDSIYSANGNTGLTRLVNITDGATNGYLNFRTLAGQQILYLDALNERVGVRKTPTTYAFEVQGSSHVSGMTIFGAGFAGSSNVGLVASDQVASKATNYSISVVSGEMNLNTGLGQRMLLTQAGSTKLAIGTNGNIGIGTASPAAFMKLHIVGGGLRIDGQTSGTAGAASGLYDIVYRDGVTYKVQLLNNA